jgi:DNA-binding winged helix-turn-helix (wHTH) protein
LLRKLPSRIGAEVQFLFDDHVLDVERRELRRAGERIAMEPQVFDLLVYLVRNRDRVLSKDDLIEAIWDGRVVSESTLTSRINAVRKAVGDSGEAQRLIRTVQRKGIRFIGEVSEAFAPREAAVAANVEPPRGAALRHEIQFCTASDGVRIAYAEVGTGPPLLKAANWLNHLEYDWESPIWSHLLHELAAEHRLIRYDARGNGLSDWEVDDISFEAFARDLESVVEATGIDRFALLGISQGCAVSIAYAVRHPQRVSSTAVSPAGGASAARPRRSSRQMRCSPSCARAGARRTRPFARSSPRCSSPAPPPNKGNGSTTCSRRRHRPRTPCASGARWTTST